MMLFNVTERNGFRKAYYQMYNPRLVGTRIRNRRKNFGWSQDQLAARVGTTSDAISEYERGERRLSLEVACKLAQELECDVNWIAGRY